MLIAFSGNLATGKSTLLSYLVENDSAIKIYLESPAANPYLNLIDSNERATLGFELHYLMRCVEIYQASSSTTCIHCIERSLEENEMFARRTLLEPDLSLFSEVFEFISNSLKTQVQGVVFLDASLETIYRNLSRRSTDLTDTEKIRTYPKKFKALYDLMKTTIEQSDNSLIINMDEYDIVKSSTDRRHVIKLVSQFIKTLE